ncbi:MAG: GtrA family protein [Campylobacterota bacterium]|nr:GtrA family protein [Campylobacterota bacterium]
MKQIKKFLYVGILATLVDFCFYSLLIYFEIFSYGMATVIGYSTGFVVSFFLTRNYAFSKIKVDKFHYEFLFVLLITFVGLLLNLFIVYVLVKLEVNEYMARVVAIGVVFFFNYFARKRFVYE